MLEPRQYDYTEVKNNAKIVPKFTRTLEAIHSLDPEIQFNFYQYFYSSAFLKSINFLQNMVRQLNVGVSEEVVSVNTPGDIFEQLAYYHSLPRLLPTERLLTPQQTQMVFQKYTQYIPDGIIFTTNGNSSQIVGVCESTMGRRDKRKSNQVKYFESGEVITDLLAKRSDDKNILFNPDEYRVVFSRLRHHQPGRIGKCEIQPLPITRIELIDISKAMYNDVLQLQKF
jgi:hypothetical protein